MDLFAVIAEGKIREAIENGEFDDLPNKGKPLDLDNMAHIPEELRAGYTILKNAGVLPEELELKKEIVSLQKLIDSCHEENERNSMQKKLTYKLLKFDMMMENRRLNHALGSYKYKIYRKLGIY
ncbi:DUF1992 domain-containing protein [Pelotomaculum propionicicum]|uniref:DnaJ homologue subfamily C member 28 conserved domain-containing protein n=1 Tax=Pelotomaculum propionicicum TaxID=258475 RepID=A0A4Y7RIF6_9FIRM|nr:DUF1992 domain-containing protein [Pelotomaculum propionicicum]NLI11249.1 DUF1992 domain-containing protein [Peptococcaceae bacterium]TEB08788.1 hypothetical protein Pmgp_03636 [Pelotomaculum propionicicum]